jgi:hypothetical protein
MVPGVERQPLKKLKPELDRLLELLQRWGNEAERSGRKIARTVVAYEAGRDGFWLARASRPTGSRRMSSILPVSRYRASTDAPRLIGSTRSS